MNTKQSLSVVFFTFLLLVTNSSAALAEPRCTNSRWQHIIYGDMGAAAEDSCSYVNGVTRMGAFTTGELDPGGKISGSVSCEAYNPDTLKWGFWMQNVVFCEDYNEVYLDLSELDEDSHGSGRSRGDQGVRLVELKNTKISQG